jgi:hypothetical protein
MEANAAVDEVFRMVDCQPDGRTVIIEGRSARSHRHKLKVAAMRLPWSLSRNDKSAEPEPVSKSEAALAGAAGDGKVHDLQYWLDSGFLTLPKEAGAGSSGG